jgi:hypothetical protein
MGWAYCGQQMARGPKWSGPNGGFQKREIGYGIEATCDKRDCETVINRGLGTVCGDMHHTPWDDEPGCGRYYCDDHHGWVGDRGGCDHRGIVAWGRTLCQPMKEVVSGRVYCACLKDHPVEWPEPAA